MFKTSILALSLVFVSPAVSAQDNPAKGTVFVYDEIQFEGGSGGLEKAVIETRILQSDADSIIHSSCRSDSSCDVIMGRDFARYHFWAYFDDVEIKQLGLDEIEKRPDANRITARDERGGDMFPLEDGKRLTWSESWVSPDYKGDFDMSVTQSCCKKASAGFSKSDELWEIRVTFHQTAGDGYSEGVQVFLYDPDLNWFVSSTMNMSYRDDTYGETTTTSTRQVLREVR